MSFLFFCSLAYYIYCYRIVAIVETSSSFPLSLDIRHRTNLLYLSYCSPLWYCPPLWYCSFKHMRAWSIWLVDFHPGILGCLCWFLSSINVCFFLSDFSPKLNVVILVIFYHCLWLCPAYCFYLPFYISSFSNFALKLLLAILMYLHNILYFVFLFWRRLNIYDTT